MITQHYLFRILLVASVLGSCTLPNPKQWPLFFGDGTAEVEVTTMDQDPSGDLVLAVYNSERVDKYSIQKYIVATGVTMWVKEIAFDTDVANVYFTPDGVRVLVQL